MTKSSLFLTNTSSWMWKCAVNCLLIYLVEGQTYSLSGSSPYGIRGGDYSFTCQISGGNLPQGVEFKKDDSPSAICTILLVGGRCEPQRPTDTRYTCGCINGDRRSFYFNITNVQSTDAVDWICKDLDENGVSSQPVTLLVYYGPENIRFKPPGSSITVIENKSISATCSADCNPPPCNISWYKGADSSGTIISSTGLLSLNNIQRQDTAYTCQVKHRTLTTTPLTKTIQITVYYGPENITFTPTGSSITLIENESRNVTCSADCNPPPCNISWYKDSTIISSTGLLSLNNIKRQQAGNYTCQVTNTQIPDSPQSKQLMVIVYYPPTITSLISDANNNTIDEDSNVTFTCSVDSLPSSLISWYRSQQGEQLYSSSQYTIPKASCQHTDDYTCTASYDIGQSVSNTIPLYVRCSPREKKETKRSITNRIDAAVDLEVDIIAYPPPTFTWYHTPTRQMINTARTQQLSTINYKSTLEITLNSTLFGDYIISVYNDIGIQNFTITVIDGEPPGQLGSNNIPTIVGSIIGVLVVIGIVIVIGVVIYRRKAKTDKPQDNVPLSNKGKKKNELVIDENLTYEGSDHIFGPQTGAGPGKGPTDNIPMSVNVKTGHDNKMVIDDNLLYEGSDHIFGPQNGTQCGKNLERGIFGQTASSEIKRNSTIDGKSKQSKNPPKKPGPEAIYTEVVKKKTGQDNKTVNGERGNHENTGVKAKPIPTKKPAINKEGLNYADVVFTNKTPAKDVKPVYHDAVEYAGIQPGVRGPTPPPVSDSSDDDDSPPPAPAPKPKTKPVKTKKK